MPNIHSFEDRQWAREQIKAFQSLQPRYAAYAAVLHQVLEKAVQQTAPLAIIQTRPKSIASFAEKIQRKKNKYRNPLQRMTDLCGGRVITQTLSEVRAVAEFIERHFDIDRENSLDVSQRLRPSEFGYRSIHYIVQFRPGVFPTKDIPVEISTEVFPDADAPMKAEIQVRTILEHAWSGFTHDRVYKGAFAIPDQWRRELAIQAGMLEEIDQSFNHVQSGLQTYMASYGAYLSKEKLFEEIELLKIVHESDPQNVEVAHRLGRLFMQMGTWQPAIDLLVQYVDSEYPPLLRDLGVALCKVHAKEPFRQEYLQGQAYLEAATAPPSRDVDALASLAGTWKSLDEDKARHYYQKAFELDPTDPYAVSNFLVYEIAHRNDLTAATLMAPSILAAIKRSRDQIGVGMNLPWAFYDLGLFHLLSDQPYESLNAYAKAVQLSTDDWMIETSLRLLDRMNVVAVSIRGFEWMRKLLILGRRVKFSNETAEGHFRELPALKMDAGSGPIVILGGGSADPMGRLSEEYRAILGKGFLGFRGTILSCGTRSGIGGLVGEFQEKNPESVRTIGYVPQTLPEGRAVDPRVLQIRKTEGKEPSALEPLQMWIDLMVSGISPQSVRLLGVHGSRLSAFEYRLALSLGATVGMMAGSGGEADRLLTDDYWKGANGLLSLPPDGMTIRAFVGSAAPRLEASSREIIGQAIHDAYREKKHRSPSDQDPACADWDCLSDSLKDSNRLQADHIAEKLDRIGCSLGKLSEVKGKPAQLYASEIETLAEMEHGRWVVERLRDGWTMAAERDAMKKTNPYLVPWSNLPEENREQDRETVRRIPEFLAKAGFAIQRRK